jgi:hypothetical protein
VPAQLRGVLGKEKSQIQDVNLWMGQASALPFVQHTS